MRDYELFAGVPGSEHVAIDLLSRYGVSQYSKSITMHLGAKTSMRPEGMFANAGPMKG